MMCVGCCLIWTPTKLISLLEEEDDKFFDEAGVMSTRIETFPDKAGDEALSAENCVVGVAVFEGVLLLSTHSLTSAAHGLSSDNAHSAASMDPFSTAASHIPPHPSNRCSIINVRIRTQEDATKRSVEDDDDGGLGVVVFAAPLIIMVLVLLMLAILLGGGTRYVRHTKAVRWSTLTICEMDVWEA